MGEDDAGQLRQHGDPHNRGGGRHFPVGSVVEVEANEEGLGGVYFSASVVPPPISRRRSNSENSERLYVEYRNLLAGENGRGRLREYVDVSSVRPAPPLQEVAKCFEPNDVVDAFYKDGWWKGVVTRVVGGGRRFVVTFEKPPDQLEFSPSALRAHWDWADGVWAGPQKLGGEVVFEEGAKVEVWFERDDDFGGAWFPATIVDLENGAYLVEFNDRDGDLVKAEVDSAHVRPCPPIFKDKKFGASERVDAFFNFGWWSGLITKKVEKNGYNVLFEYMKLNKVMDRSELRVHIDWKDGKWLIESSLTSNLTASSSTKRRKSCLSDSRGGALKKHKGQNEHANQETEQIVTKKIVIQDEEQNENIQTPSLIDAVEKLGEPQSLISSVLIDVGLNEHANQETEQTAIEKIAFEDKGPPMGAENVSVEQQIEDEDIQTPSLVDGSSLVPECGRQAPTEPQSLVSSVVINEGSIAPNELPDCGWPFVKCNVAWKAIESMEVMRRIPQKPHFQPLSHFSETAREGMAIGCMVTFSNVVERSCSLNINDPKCMMEDINQTLLDLETHGFNVGMVRDRVMKLLAEKEDREEEGLVNEVKAIKDQIEEHMCIKSKIEKEIRVINGHIKRLKQQLELSKLAKVKEVQQIAHLQAGLDQIDQRIKTVRCDFEGVAVLLRKLQF